MKKKIVKTKFRVGQKVRLVPRNKLPQDAAFRVRWGVTGHDIYGIRNETYDAAARKIQRVSWVDCEPVYAVGLKGLSIPFWPVVAVRAVKPAKRKAKA